ncbi:MAG: helix-turn-helix domain-containing protein [Butyrivibrio sp.]
MEFKDKLKRLRKEKGISQQKLSEAVYVSRSAVAKWENGLGFPCKESLDELSDYFGVTDDFWVTEEPETVIVEKNKSISRLRIIIMACIIATVLAVGVLLMASLVFDNFGLTSKMAAGGLADNPCIETADYDFYYYIFGGEEGSGCEYIAGFRPVKKLFIGYAVFEKDYEYDALYVNDEQVGIIYSIEGEDGYYNIFRAMIYTTGPVLSYFQDLDRVTAGGKTYEVLLNSFFISEEPVKEFCIDNVTFTVSEIENE